MKPLLSLIAAISLAGANDYKIDLMDDVFDLELQDLQQLKVTSASKSLQSLNFTPARVIVVTQEQIRERGYRGLDELLNDLPGFQIMRYADSGILNQIGIRGIMGTNYFKVLQDGIEIDQTDGEVLSHGMQYPLLGLERVEILYGPASVVYGADALSGVINLISSDAPRDEISISGGARGYRYAHGVTSFPLMGGKLTLKAHYHTDQDYELDKEYPNDFLRQDIVSGGTLIQSAQDREFDFQPHTTRSAAARYTSGGFDAGVNYRFSSESTLIAMNGLNSLSNLFDNESNLDTENVGYYGRYSGTFFDGVRSTTTLSYDSTELLIDSYFINRYTSYRPAYKYSFSEKYALEETLNKRFGAHDLTAGFSYERLKSTPMTYDLPFPTLDQPIFYAGSGDTIPAPIFHLEWNNKALYLQDQVSLSDTVELSLAGRYDNSSSYGSTFNPRFALLHSNGEITQKLIYSQAYLAPSDYQKYKIYGNALQASTLGDGNLYMTERFRVANPDLKPEKSKNVEYNLDLFLSKNDQVSFSMYYTKIKDIILIEETLPEKAGFIPDTTILDPVGAVNAAEAVVYGGDLSYQGHSYFTGFDVDYWANYSFIDGEMDHGSACSLPYSASHVFKSGATLQYQNWHLSPSLRWMSPIRASHYVDGDLARVNGHFIANLYGSYEFDKYKTVSFKINNLFDSHYYGVRYNTSSKYRSPQDTRMFWIAFTMSL